MSDWDMGDEDFAAWFVTAPTEASVNRSLRDEQRTDAAKRRADEIADWRRRNPQATCSDSVAGMLVDMEMACRPIITAKEGAA